MCLNNSNNRHNNPHKINLVKPLWTLLLVMVVVCDGPAEPQPSTSNGSNGYDASKSRKNVKIKNQSHGRKKSLSFWNQLMVPLLLLLLRRTIFMLLWKQSLFSAKKI